MTLNYRKCYVMFYCVISIFPSVPTISQTDLLIFFFRSFSIIEPVKKMEMFTRTLVVPIAIQKFNIQLFISQSNLRYIKWNIPYHFKILSTGQICPLRNSGVWLVFFKQQIFGFTANVSCFYIQIICWYWTLKCTKSY